jgi:hypothetical protein
VELLWEPPQGLSALEKRIASSMKRVRKLLPFLREHRHEIFDRGFQEELGGIYRQSGAGKPPVPPAQLAMALLVQAYLGVSDAELIQLTVMDRRVQMVLDCLDAERAPFSQGALVAYRERLIGSELDRRLLERTAQVARTSAAFDARKLPQTLRIAVDARPLEGAGRVEDTINLLAHAARKVVACAARLLGRPKEQICQEAGIPLLLESSAKRGLDLKWTQAAERAIALDLLLEQLDALAAWIGEHLSEERERPPLREPVQSLAQIREQDLEPDPDGSGMRLREGVAEDRRISIEDPQMRHGRKSRSRRFNGYRQHVASELDTTLILACAITAGNRPEGEAAPALLEDLARHALPIAEMHIDRGYVASELVSAVQAAGGTVLCKPWNAGNGSQYPKSAFVMDMRSRTITCPQGRTERFALGEAVEFAPVHCDPCPVRSACTRAAPGRGRTVNILENEPLQQRMRKLQASAAGRARLRQRAAVEHRLAHLARRQGPRARYRGVRKNLLDLRRTAALQNLEAWQRLAAA